MGGEARQMWHWGNWGMCPDTLWNIMEDERIIQQSETKHSHTWSSNGILKSCDKLSKQAFISFRKSNQTHLVKPGPGRLWEWVGRPRHNEWGTARRKTTIIIGWLENSRCQARTRLLTSEQMYNTEHSKNSATPRPFLYTILEAFLKSHY